MKSFLRLSPRFFSSSPVDLYYKKYDAIRTSENSTLHRPLIIIHGLLGHSNNWTNVVSKTEFTKDRDVYCVDLRNHGMSPHSNSFTFEALSNDIIHVLDKNNIGQADILGHSLGGKVAMATALTHGVRVGSLVVADISPKVYPSDDPEMLDVQNILKTVNSVDLGNKASRADIDKQLSQHISQVGVRQFILTNLVTIKPGEPNPTNAEYKWKPNVSKLLQQYPIVRDFVLPQTWDYFRGPTLFVRGAKSAFINPQTFKDDVSQYFKGDIELVELDAGHWVHAEKPREFIKAVVSFLKEHEFN